MGFEVEDFGSSEAALRYIQERSEDIEEVVIPQTLTLIFTEPGHPSREFEVGMVLEMINGHKKIVTPTDAELILNDGILNRMRIRIKLGRPK